MITQAELKEKLHYDPDTGIFTWLQHGRYPSFYLGKQAGCTDKKGYRCICLSHKLYSEHRLAWLYMTGAFPDKFIDHINGVGLDNRWCNLRQATNSENIHNSKIRSDNKLGFKGVSKQKGRATYVVEIHSNGVRHCIGGFKAPEIANEFAMLMRETMHGQFARHV